MKNFIKGRIYILVALVVLLGVFFSGYSIGKNDQQESYKITSIINKISTSTPTNVDFDPFWKAWNVINDKYVSSATSTEKSILNQTGVFMRPSLRISVVRLCAAP